MDREVFLSYDCGHAKIIFTSPLGEEVKTIKAWETQIEILRDIRDQLRDFTLEKNSHGYIRKSKHRRSRLWA